MPRLSDDTVIAIRTAAATERVTYRRLAQRFGISPSILAQIARGDIYCRVGGPLTVRGSAEPRTTPTARPKPQKPGKAPDAHGAPHRARPVVQAPQTSWTVELTDRVQAPTAAGKLELGTPVRLRGQTTVMTIDGVDDLRSRGIVHVTWLDTSGHLQAATLMAATVEIVK